MIDLIEADLVEVGCSHKKKVTPLNNELYKQAVRVMEESADEGLSCWHIGWQDVGVFIDWLEEHYDITKREAEENNE